MVYTCTICISEISKYELFLTSCMHHFHFSCIYKLYNSTDEPTCPQCRYPIENEEIDSIADKLKSKYNYYSEIAHRISKEITLILSDADGDYIDIDNYDIMKLLQAKAEKLKTSLDKALKWYPMKDNIEINISDDE